MRGSLVGIAAIALLVLVGCADSVSLTPAQMDQAHVMFSAMNLAYSAPNGTTAVGSSAGDTTTVTFANHDYDDGSGVLSGTFARTSSDGGTTGSDTVNVTVVDDAAGIESISGTYNFNHTGASFYTGSVNVNGVAVDISDIL